jgi:hypothetical protein
MAAKRRNNLWLTLAFLFFGYLGAANFYSYLIGLNTQTQILCPVCPHILSAGDPLTKFFSRVAVLGTFNGLFFLIVGWFFVFLVRRARRNFTQD